METIIVKDIQYFCHANNIFPKQQHGFISHKWMVLYHRVEAIDEKKPTDIKCPDYEKAFDRVL